MKYTNTNDSKLTTKNSISGCDYNVMINIGTPPCSILKDKCGSRVISPRDKEVVGKDDKDPTGKEVVGKDDKDPTDKEVVGEDDNIRELIKITPEVKEVLSHLKLTVSEKTKDILDADTYDYTGQNLYGCSKVLSHYSDTLKLSKSKHLLKANCDKDLDCKNCIEAINSSIIVSNQAPSLQYTATSRGEEVIFVNVLEFIEGESMKGFFEMV